MKAFNKMSLLPMLGILCVYLMASCHVREKATEQRPNILFIMTDDHSLQTISAYDSRFIETPNIDRIAENGVIFNNSFVGNSICAPSRATMLTGKHTHINGQINNEVEFDGSQQTFPKLLQKAGYQTALIGKWHLKSDPTGFDYWNILPGQGYYYNPDFVEMGEEKQHEGYVTTLTSDFALDWLENKSDKKKPFCLLLHQKAPHRVWEPDTMYLDDFENTEFPLPDNFFDTYEGRQAASEQKQSIRSGDMDLVYDLKMEDKEGEMKSRFEWYPGHTSRMNEGQKEAWEKHYTPIVEDFKKQNLSGEELYKWKYQRYMKDYLSCIKSVDENIGRVLDYLEENGQLENTLVVYTSDQGFYMGEHGWFDKRFMYEESFRTPLLMHLPKGYEPRGHISELVQNIDYAPTFLDMAGIDVPEDMQGASLKPLLKAEDPADWRKGVYYHYYEFPNEHMVKRHYGIRTDRYKLIHFYYDIDTWELYDLEKDPNEMNNLYGKDEYKELIGELKTQLEELQTLYQDPITKESKSLSFSDRILPAPKNGGYEDANYWVWGSSVIKGEDGKYHMFASRWPKKLGFGKWVSNSEVVHAIADTPVGPYKTVDIALPMRGKEYWDGMCTHNPRVIKYDDKFLLYYFGNTYDFEQPTIENKELSRENWTKAWLNKRIGVAISKSVYGPWKRLDKPVIEPRPGHWDASITSNPAPVVNEKTGEILLMYKSSSEGPQPPLLLGVSKATQPEGPYKRLSDKPVFRFETPGNEHVDVEDPYIWWNGNRYEAIIKDRSGEICGEEGGGIHAWSDDGVNWKLFDKVKAYSRDILWDDGSTTHQNHFERPFLLIEDGIPTHLFAATGNGDKAWSFDKTWNMVIPLKTDF